MCIEVISNLPGWRHGWRQDSVLAGVTRVTRVTRVGGDTVVGGVEVCVRSYGNHAGLGYNIPFHEHYRVNNDHKRPLFKVEVFINCR